MPCPARLLLVRARNRWLLALFPFTTPKDIVIRSCFFAIGFAPIASISLSTFQWVPACTSAAL